MRNEGEYLCPNCSRQTTIAMETGVILTHNYNSDACDNDVPVTADALTVAEQIELFAYDNRAIYGNRDGLEAFIAVGTQERMFGVRLGMSNLSDETYCMTMVEYKKLALQNGLLIHGQSLVHLVDSIREQYEFPENIRGILIHGTPMDRIMTITEMLLVSMQFDMDMTGVGRSIVFGKVREAMHG